MIQIRGVGLGSTGQQFALCEVGVGPNSTFGANNTRQTIGTIGVGTTGPATSPGGSQVETLTLTGLSIPVAAEETIYLHLLADAGVTPQATAMLYVEEAVESKRRGR